MYLEESETKKLSEIKKERLTNKANTIKTEKILLNSLHLYSSYSLGIVREKTIPKK